MFHVRGNPGTMEFSYVLDSRFRRNDTLTPSTSRLAGLSTTKEETRCFLRLKFTLAEGKSP